MLIAVHGKGEVAALACEENDSGKVNREASLENGKCSIELGRSQVVAADSSASRRLQHECHEIEDHEDDGDCSRPKV
jgi:hypothetical protein